MHAVLFTGINPSLDFGAVRSPGPYRIAHWLRTHNWDIEVVDFVNFWPLDFLKLWCKNNIREDTKFIGLSFLFQDRDLIDLEFILWIKQTWPHIKIISGGPDPFPYYQEHIDYMISGYGEYAILELLKYLFSNGKRPYFLIGPKVKLINANKFYAAYPLSSYMIKYQDRDYIQPDEWLGIEMSRGCMFSCAFCAFPVMGVKTDHTRSSDDFREELVENHDRFGVTKYIVADETFNDRTDKITKFANVVQSLDFSPLFSGYIRADLLTTRPNELEELLRMNFLIHFYGIETFNHNTGKIIGKGMHPDKLKDGLLRIKNFFLSNDSKRYRGQISLIIGLPQEDKESILKGKDWLEDNWTDQSFIAGTYEIGSDIELYNNKSKIQKDLPKYKYEMLSDEEIESYGFDKKLKDPTKMDSNTPFALLWKNEHMNIFEADEISHQFSKMAGDKFMLCSQQFSKIVTKDPFSTRQCDHMSDIAVIKNNIKKYISSKLSSNTLKINYNY